MTAHPPAPGNKEKNKDLVPQEKTMECVKNAHDGPLSLKVQSQTKKKKGKSTMPALFPLNIYTLDSKPCSHKVENRYDKTWLEK